MRRRPLPLLGLVRAVGVEHELLLEALSLGWPDFEDAVQAMCAASAGADHLVTRNPAGLRDVSTSVITPSELLAILSGPRPGDPKPPPVQRSD